MKKFLLKVLLFFACVVVMDIAFGQLFSYLRVHAKGGSTANCEYIANQCQDDIIIIGSSRATHHYVPKIIEDSLGMSCCNCGEEGNGVVLAYGRLKMLTERYTPKLVLYELTPGYDYGTKEPNNKYLGYLRAYYDKKGIKVLFEDFDDDLSWLKMKSKMYQNTSRLLPDVFDNILYRDNHKGYEPLYGKMILKENQFTVQNYQDLVFAVDSVKLSYIERVIDLCKEEQIPLLFMISPRYGMAKPDMSIYEPALSICKQYNVPVYNYISCMSISDHIEFFQDEGHMNNQGAEAYTSLLINDVLRKIISQ